MKRAAALVVLLGLCATPAWADGLIYRIDTDRLAYTGTVQRYGSLQDAIDRTNPTSVFDIGTLARDASPNQFDNGFRDLSSHITQNYTNVQGAEADFGNTAEILTAWFYTTGTSFGQNNPNIAPGLNGLLQIFDSDGSSITDVTGQFSNKVGSSWTSFDFILTGQNALHEVATDNRQDRTKLFWRDGFQDGVFGNDESDGDYHSYELSVHFDGLNGVELNAPGDPLHIKAEHFDLNSQLNIIAAGTFKAVFSNTNSVDPSLNGFYAVDLQIVSDAGANQDKNWAFHQAMQEPGLNEGVFPFRGTLIEYAVPLPGGASMGLVLMGALALVRPPRRLRRRALAPTRA